MRALKTLLVSAGGLKRIAIAENKANDDDNNMRETEKRVLIQGACNNVVPKLVAEDMPLFKSLLTAVFPGCEVARVKDEKLRTIVNETLICNDYTPHPALTEKILQLRQVLSFRHGIMLVGGSGSGKSTAINVLLQAMERLDGVKGDCYVIEPKSVSKEQLFGKLDATTMEWTDGIFTQILRTVISNQRGESKRRHWIVFDGDVDPEWAENLNSVLDDNKMLTLPSGERLSIPDNMRIMLEVDSLEQATPATVSRCGMLWFSESCITNFMCIKRIINKLKRGSRWEGEGGRDESYNEAARENSIGSSTADTDHPEVSRQFASKIEHFFEVDGIVNQTLVASLKEASHIMTPTRERLLQTFECLLLKGVEEIVEYNNNHIDFPMTEAHLETFSKNWLHYSLLWAFCGSSDWKHRNAFSDMLKPSITTCGGGGGGGGGDGGEASSLFDSFVKTEDGSFDQYASIVPKMEIESHKVNETDVVITTSDTLRHFDVLKAWINAREPVILCGPPGSGKSMTLMAVLNSLPDIILAPLNFSSGTTPDLILKTFHQYCEYKQTAKGIVMAPKKELGSEKWLTIFCDEINLPASDKYGTQRVISFLRQLTEVTLD